jgi:LDH2 family malate/lactate/ureidoglycolate dehydrogenase
MEADYVRIKREILEYFCQQVFQSLHLTESEARVASAVLVAADARGIPSHGVGRLWRYVGGIKTGLMVPNASLEILRETPSSVVMDAHGAMGASASFTVMERIIHKAAAHGAAFGSVRNSNHFGIAGYYAMMALEEDMIGIAMTNTAAMGAPTFGCQVKFGTNPLAFAVPAQEERAFVLDMSTTVVTRGKIEVYHRLGKELPVGWAVDKTGQPARDARSFLHDTLHRIGGGILPLGGAGEEFGGHKGYGLAVMIDILCALLSGAPFGDEIMDTEASSARVSHFFGAIRIDMFRDPQDFRRNMDRMLKSLRETPPAEGAERVYFAGQKEFEMEDTSLKMGVPLLKKTYDQIGEIGKEYGVSPPPNF